MVVVYGPDGQREAFYNGTSTTASPDIPSTFTVEQTYSQIDRRIDLESPESGQHFLARVGGLLWCRGIRRLHPDGDPAARPDGIGSSRLTSASTLRGLLILIATALLTRWLVTLAFRNLRQVETTPWTSRRETSASA